VAERVAAIKSRFDPMSFPASQKPAAMPHAAGEPAAVIPGGFAVAGTLSEASGAPVSEVGEFAGVVSGDVSHEKGAGASHTAAPPPVTLPGGIIRGETMDMRRGGAITERRYAESPAAPVHEPEPELASEARAAVEMALPVPAPAAFVTFAGEDEHEEPQP
jgi:hypothetical protein